MKNAFIDGQGVLRAYGFMESNGDQQAIPVDDDFEHALGAWRYVGGSWIAYAPPVLTLEGLKAKLTEAATAKRWEIETGGIVLPSGERVATDKADQDRITSVIVNAAAAGIETIDFKGATGWMTLTIAQMSGIAIAVAQHVQACFSAERQHHEAIAALSIIESAQAYDLSSGWPQSSLSALPEA